MTYGNKPHGDKPFPPFLPSIPITHPYIRVRATPTAKQLKTYRAIVERTVNKMNRIKKTSAQLPVDNRVTLDREDLQRIVSEAVEKA